MTGLDEHEYSAGVPNGAAVAFASGAEPARATAASTFAARPSTHSPVSLALRSRVRR
jgi:hypothetical protein